MFKTPLAYNAPAGLAQLSKANSLAAHAGNSAGAATLVAGLMRMPHQQASRHAGYYHLKALVGAQHSILRNGSATCIAPPLGACTLHQQVIVNMQQQEDMVEGQPLRLTSRSTWQDNQTANSGLPHQYVSVAFELFGAAVCNRSQPAHSSFTGRQATCCAPPACSQSSATSTPETKGG